MENIDKILKESFEGFTPDAPNVWSNVSQQVGNHAIHQSVAGKAAAAFKSATVLTKVLIVAALPVISGVGYAVYQSTKSTSTQVEIPLTNQANHEDQVELNQPELTNVVSDNQVKSTPKEVTKIQKEEISTAKNQNDIRQQIESNGSLNLSANSQNNNINNTQPNHLATAKSENIAQTKPKMIDRSERSQHPAKEVATLLEDNDNITIPDVFTPGDIDGKNDDFKILIDNEKTFYLKVFDINDNLVFESNSKENTWDGKNYKNGQNCEEGIYTFVFIYELNNGKSGTKSGKIKLIR